MRLNNSGKVEGAAVAVCESDAGYTSSELAKHGLDIQNACLNKDRVGSTKKNWQQQG